MKIEFSSQDKPQEWLNMIARQFGAKVKENVFELPMSVGEGIFKQFYPFAGLTLSYLHFRVFEPLEFIRKAVDTSQLVPVMFYSQDWSLEQDIDEQKKLIGYHTSNGIFMPSPQIQSRWIIPPNIWVYQVTLSFEREWLLATLNYTEDTYLHQMLESGKPFCLFESLTPAMMHLIRSIHELINSSNKLQKLQMHQKAMDLFILFLEKVEQRAIIKDAANLYTTDLEKVFQTRKHLLDNLTETPSVKQLAIDAGMSVSKLQKCFRQVFGKSISQYALSEKMNLAKQLLDSKKYSVSEVGYQIGYSNLSHFTKAFNKEFNINPKSYLNT